MKKVLELYKGALEFPNKDEQVILTSFTYNAARMAATPTIKASFMYSRCLDNDWTEEVYAEFNGEKYYIKSVPTSMKDNKTMMYKHDIILYSERFILDNTYFYDTIKVESNGSFDIVSNTTEFVDYCDLIEFAKRLNDSMEYSGLDYRIDIKKLEQDYPNTEPKQISLSQTFLSTAIQEIYNQWQIPFYFQDKSIIIGEGELIADQTLEYGGDKSLMSVKKNNANAKIITRCSGFGSEKNIPFYYPNWSQKGNIGAFALDTNQYLTQDMIQITDMKKFDKFCPLNGKVTYFKHFLNPPTGNATKSTSINGMASGNIPFMFPLNVPENNLDVYFDLTINLVETCGFSNSKYFTLNETDDLIRKNYGWEFDVKADVSPSAQTIIKSKGFQENNRYEGDRHTNLKWIWEKTYIFSVDFPASFEDEFSFGEDIYMAMPNIYYNIPKRYNPNGIIGEINKYWKHSGTRHLLVSEIQNHQCQITATISNIRYVPSKKDPYWILNGDEEENHAINLEDIGIKINATPNDDWIGEGFQQTKIAFIPVAKTLMPSTYRDTIAKNIFYNAINYDEGTTPEQPIYKNPDDGKYYIFENELTQDGSNKREQIQGFEDIYPTITNVRNDEGQAIDRILDVAFDANDNNEVDEEGKFLHPYFFVKIPKTSGSIQGFNIFNQKLVGQNMTLSFTSGDCSACVFEIDVSANKDPNNKDYEHVINPIKVVNGKPTIVSSIKEVDADQQDSSKNSIWLILKKDDQTFNETMPNNPTIVPKSGDTFVLLNIDPPRQYILDAERKLDEAIIRYMWENNSDKFNFNVDFSRIFLQENKTTFTDRLNENVRVNVKYNGFTYPLYVNSFKYEVKNNDVIPKITIGLADKVTVNRSVTQSIADGLMKDVMSNISVNTYMGDLSKQFVRKQYDDETYANLTIGKNLKVNGKTNLEGDVNTNNITTKNANVENITSKRFSGDDTLGTGFQISENIDGISTLTIDNVKVRRKLQVTELVIQQIRHQGGIVWQTAAGMECNKVEDNTTFYRCYFDNKEGAISNQFAVDDLARCQRIGYSPKYYWRKVVGVGIDYIDLSNVEGEYEQYSDIPTEGDVIVQLGNTTNKDRQSAIEMTTIGNQAPSFKMYNGINSFSLLLKDITGIMYDDLDQKPHLYSYGDMFFGARPNPQGKSSTYIKYDSSTQQMDIKAKLSVKAPDTGIDSDLDNILNGIDNKAQNAQSSIDNLQIGGTNLVSNLSINWEKGSIYESKPIGTYWTDCSYQQGISKGIRTRELLPINGEIILSINPLYKVLFMSFDENKKSVGQELGFYNDCANQPIILDKSIKYIWIVIFDRNDRDLTSNDIIDCRLKVEQGNKTTTWSPSIQDTKQQLSDAEDRMGENLATEVTKINGDIQNLKNQIDGKVDSYFLPYVPTLNNAPANEWTTTELKKQHIGDTFTNTESNQSWRWYNDQTKGYNWYPIQDTQALEALEAAKNAQATADGKATIFTTNDTTLIKNYHNGDMWILPLDMNINSKNYLKGDILTASFTITEENKGIRLVFTSKDWSKEVRYTDDYAAKEAQNIANDVSNRVNNLKIGGVNLILKSNKPLDFYNYDEGSYSYAENKEIPNITIDKAITYYFGGGNVTSNLKGVCNVFNPDTLLENQEYTFSIWAYNSHDVLSVEITTSLEPKVKYTLKPLEVKKLVFIGKQNIKGYTQLHISSPTKGYCQVTLFQPMFELGNVPSEWTLAPQDIIRAEHNRLVDTYKMDFVAQSNFAYRTFTPTIELKPNTDYVFSIEKTILNSGNAKEFSVYIYDKDIINSKYEFTIPISNKTQYKVFTTPSNIASDDVILIYCGVKGSTNDNNITFNRFKLAEGNVYTGWSAASTEEYEALRAINTAMKGSTEEIGGLVLTNLIEMKGEDNKTVTAGMSGIVSQTKGIHFWGGSDLANIEKAPFRVYNNGECYATRFYGFSPAFEINNSNKNKFITNNTIDVDKLGGKVLLNLTNSQLGGSLSFPIGEKYIGSEIEIYNPNMLPFNICSDSLVSPRYATLDNAFDLIMTNKITDYSYYHKELQGQGVPRPVDYALKWSIKYTIACMVENVSPEYSIWKCVKFIPKAANVDGYFKLKGDVTSYYKNYGTTANPIYILWILKEQRGTGKFKLEF